MPSLPLSFTPNLITVILSTIYSVSLNYPVFSRSRTLLLVLSSKLPSPVISLSSYALFIGSGSLSASNTSSSHVSTKFSQIPNLHTFIISSLFNVLAVLARSSSVVTLARPFSSSSLKNKCLVVNVCRGTARRPRYKYSITARRKSVVDS